jgi:hypothetical protein
MTLAFFKPIRDPQDAWGLTRVILRLEQTINRFHELVETSLRHRATIADTVDIKKCTAQAGFSVHVFEEYLEIVRTNPGEIDRALWEAWDVNQCRCRSQLAGRAQSKPGHRR